MEKTNDELFDGTPKTYGEQLTKFKIKRFDDALFNVDLEVSDEHETYEEALTKLGYFIVSEIK